MFQPFDDGRKHGTWGLICVSACAALAGCDSGLSTLAPAGPAAGWIANLWWAMLAGAALLTGLVWMLVVIGFRQPGQRQPSTRFWALGMGVAMPLAVLTVLVGAGLWIGERMQPRPSSAVVAVRAEARQWAWSFEQPGSDGEPVRTENVLYIPAGRPVDVQITSRDVLHSFWVPRLGGKMDAVPGHPNVLRIQADAPGRYQGKSAEFSGVGYSTMDFTVVAYAPDQVPDLRAQGQAANRQQKDSNERE